MYSQSAAAEEEEEEDDIKEGDFCSVAFDLFSDAAIRYWSSNPSEGKHSGEQTCFFFLASIDVDRGVEGLAAFVDKR